MGVLVTSGMYRQANNTDILLPVKDHPKLDSKYLALGNQLGIEIAQKVFAQVKADQSHSLGRDNWLEINFTVSLSKKEESLESDSPIQWKDNRKVEIYLTEKRSENQKVEKILFKAVVDVAAQKFKNDFKEFKKANQEYKFFCYGTIHSPVESQTIINNIVLRAWKEERVPKNENEESELLTNIFFGTLAIAFFGLGFLIRKT